MNHEPIPELWWIAKGNHHEGPFPVEEIRQRLRDAKLTLQQLACPVGGQEWKSLAKWSERFAGLFVVPPQEDSKSSKHRDTKTSLSTKPSWNPVAIAWLGFLFTPLWSGIMAANNVRRLGLDQPLWRPLAIGIGSFVLSLLVVLAGIDLGYFMEAVIFTAIPLLALWHLDPQMAAHTARPSHNHDHWIMPVFAGSPLALLTILGYGMLLFGPLEPRQVVERFVNAKSVKECRKHVTSNLYPMIGDIEELQKLTPDLWVKDDTSIEYLTEAYAENDDNQYYVEYRMYTPPHDNEPSNTLQGYFHLYWLDGAWKIEDWLITSHNGAANDDGPVSFAFAVRALLEQERQKAGQNPPQPKKLGWLLDWFLNLTFAQKFIVVVIGMSVIGSLVGNAQKTKSP